MTSLPRILPLLLLLAASSQARAHARLIDPVPRNTQDGYKEPLAVANCGVARNVNQPVTTLTAGSTITVYFEETINHSGCFIVDLSAGGNDQNWMELAVVPHNTATTTPREYQTDVTLPAGVTCQGCTLRLRQLMVPNAGCPPANVPSGATYYSCANIVLEEGAAAPDAGATAGSSSSSGGTTGSTSQDNGGGDSGGGCACVAKLPTGAAPAGLLGLALVLLARRRKFQR